MGNDKKQPHFTELVWESTEQNVAIPPRNSSEEVKPNKIRSIKAASDTSVQLQLWDIESEVKEPVTTTEGEFVKRARELEHRKEAPALFVPFKSYWPTYGHMTGAQNRWYFYWRDEVRSGRYHKTDLSYIFLHVYELINGVGWDTPSEGYRQLCQLWEAYRDTYKRLDQYLGGWIADFSFVHHLEVPLSTIVARSRGLAGDLAELELMRCLSSYRELLSFAGLTVMSDYDISKSKFYLGEGKEAAERYIPQVVALIDAYVTRKHGKNLVQMFPPSPPLNRERYLFRSAVYDISLYGYSILIPVVRVSKSLPLRSLITRLFRLTENKLRELMGYRGRLKGVKVDADMDDLVTRFLHREFRKSEQEQKGPVVVIDQEKLERLQTDSEIVRTLLMVEEVVIPDEMSEDDYEIAATTDDEKPKEIVVSVNLDADFEIVRATGWEKFAAVLSPLQREAILLLNEVEGWLPFQKLAVSSGTMPELLIDEINELAMDTLGDLLIDGEEISEEYAPMLQYLMR
ncbi:TerB N-terminal domain-containing protein [Paenibacillus wynnii]|uniref:TerB N-terminal domain-containing protein n=1 Tax=Paenibacillus wynnii TaxID=268407 RepID=UPI0027937DAB|nr:TerB N-terminal domain-containing protein [Paenibacillus wynnii]MDQ0195036.1 hypothetical protein [Paenibacillus wynnii]